PRLSVSSCQWATRSSICGPTPQPGLARTPTTPKSRGSSSRRDSTFGAGDTFSDLQRLCLRIHVVVRKIRRELADRPHVDLDDGRTSGRQRSADGRTEVIRGADLPEGHPGEFGEAANVRGKQVAEIAAAT